MVLFDETRVLNPQADKTNVALSFSVPPGLTALQVEFTYDPAHPTGAGGGRGGKGCAGPVCAGGGAKGSVCLFAGV